jgi:cell division protein ZapE
MWGGVGRGKSFLMDSFYSVVPVVRKTRLHFHEFMRGVHRQLDELKGVADPLDEVAKRIAKKYRLICFDEFHVSDVADAMIMYNLLSALFDNGVSFVMTSNYDPDTAVPGRPAPRPHAADHRAAEGQAGRDERRRRCRLPQPRAGAGQAYYTPLNAATDKALREAYAKVADTADEIPGAHRAARDPRAAARRRRDLVRLRHPVRRPALAERLPGTGQPLPYRDPVRHPGDVGRPCRPRRAASPG